MQIDRVFVLIDKIVFVCSNGVVRSRQAGFIPLPLIIILGTVLVGGVSVAAVKNEDEIREAVKKLPEVRQRIEAVIGKDQQTPDKEGAIPVQARPRLVPAEGPVGDGERVKISQEIPPLPPKVDPEPKENPITFCLKYPDYCNGTIVDTVLLCQVNPVFCSQRQILPGQPIIPGRTIPSPAGQPPVVGNVDPRSNPSLFCQTNPVYCFGGQINTILLCQSNPSFCQQHQLSPGQPIVPGISQPGQVPGAVPIIGNVDPKENPTGFCQLNPALCLSGSVNTTVLCAQNPSYCAQNQLFPGQPITPQSTFPQNQFPGSQLSPHISPNVNPYANPNLGQPVSPQQPLPQNQFLNPQLNPNINPYANPNINPNLNPNINPYANPNINPYMNPNLFPMGPPPGIPSHLNPYGR